MGSPRLCASNILSRASCSGPSGMWNEFRWDSQAPRIYDLLFDFWFPSFFLFNWDIPA